MINDIYMPARVFVFAEVYSIQRSEAYWADLLAFKPER
jgi:hypothetical protein